jgi:transcriptional regulator with GAF, ATPase, and Fis domain
MARRKNIHISLYFIIPTIFSGLSFIAVIVAYRIASHYLQIGIVPDEQIILLGIAIAVFIFFCGFLIIRLVLNPFIQFVKTAEKLPVISQNQQVVDNSGQPESIEHLHLVLDQVTTILGQVEARKLFPEIIGQSRAMREIFSQIMKVAPTSSTVLISGESGTGKELVATGIYEHSLRKGKPFVKINCVAIPESLLESELFGHEKGAFTGAVALKKGKFELADGGTVFLDEIGDMPLTTQAKILRVLQEKEFERVGGTSLIRVDVRFIAATNKNLSELIRAGTFREDLYHRLNVFSLNMPPLRERRDDIAVLAEYFLGKDSRRVELSTPALNALVRYDWPGNVRELQNTLERAAVMTENGIIEPNHLPHYLFTHDATRNSSIIGHFSENLTLDDWLHNKEKELIVEALKRAGGIQIRAAELLGINQRSLWHRIKKYAVDGSYFKKHQKM